MLTRIINQVAPQFARLFVLVLAALASSSAGAQPAHAASLPSAGPAALLPFTSHGQVLGLQPGGLNASINPTLTWNTFLGGSENDYAEAVAVDRNGYVYVVGGSFATWGVPVRNYAALEDAFVAKLSPSGALLWNTFLGGNSFDYSRGVAVDGQGNVYVVGSSLVQWGSDIPRLRTDWDAFAAKLSPNGALLWSTFLGGKGNDEGLGIAVDGTGNVYVAGTSDNSWRSPVHPYSAQEDAYAAKLSPNGTLLWSTFLGGSGHDWGRAVAVDGNGNVHVSGQSDATWGSPVRPFTYPPSGWQDAFAAKLGPGGELDWNTFLGGNGEDTGHGIAVDGTGNVYVVGDSSGTWAEWGAPVRPYSDADAFAVKLSPVGDLSWNTFLGGAGVDGGNAIALDGDGNVYMAGFSLATWGSPVRPHTTDADAFAATLGASGELAWNTFLGGSGIDVGNAIAVGATGNVCVVGYSTSTWGVPVRMHTGGSDAFVARIDMMPLYLPLIIR